MRTLLPCLCVTLACVHAYAIPMLQADQPGEFPLQEGVLAGVKKRLDLPFHGGGVDGSGRQLGFLSCASTENTLRYIRRCRCRCTK